MVNENDVMYINITSITRDFPNTVHLTSFSYTTRLQWDAQVISSRQHAVDRHMSLNIRLQQDTAV